MHAAVRSLMFGGVFCIVSTAALFGQTASLHRFAQGGKYGFKSDDGQVRIQPTYDGAFEFREGLAPVAVVRGKQLAANGSYGPECFEAALNWGYIDASGRFIVDPRYAEAKPFSEGVAAVRAGELWGYIDTAGRWVIKPAYSHAGDFQNGIAEVTANGKTVYVTRTGSAAPPPAPDDYDVFRVSMRYDSALDPPRLYTAVDRDGKEIARRSDGLELLGEGRVRYGADTGPAGLMDLSGRVLTPQTFEALEEFSDGLAAVKVKGNWGFIDRSGRMVIAPRKFARVGRFQEGLASACVRVGSSSAQELQDERCGFIDMSGEFVVSPRFGAAYEFENGWASVRDPVFENKLFINRQEKIVHRASPDDEPVRRSFGKCQFPLPAPAPSPRDYSIAIDVRTSPPGASVYLVPLWDWQSNANGKRLLADPGLLSLYLVTAGSTPLKGLKLKMQVYMAVLELRGNRKISRLVVSPNLPTVLEVPF